MRVFLHYCVPVAWICFYLYHGVRLGKPSPALQDRFVQRYSPDKAGVVTKYLSIGAWLGAILTALSVAAELAGLPVKSELAGFFYGCIILVYILIVHLCVRRSMK